MPTVQGAGSVNPTITNGTNSVVFGQASTIIQNAINLQSVTVGGGFSSPTVQGGVAGELIVNTVFNASVSAPGFRFFVIGDALNPISVTAGGALHQAVILGAGPISFIAGGGSGIIVAGDGNKRIDLQTGHDFGVYAGSGNDTIEAGQSLAGGRNTVEAGLGNNVIHLGAAPTDIRSTGRDTIAVSAGSTMIQTIGNGQVSVTGGAGSVTLVNANGPSTVSGGTGAATVLGGAGGGLFTGGSGGNNLLLGGEGATNLTGAGAGDVLIGTSGSAMQVLRAGAGNETLIGSLSSADNVFSAGPGANLILAGSGNDTIYAGAGAATVTGGGGFDTFRFNPIVAHGGAVTITDFTPGIDRISLVGYGDAPANLAAAAQHPTSTSSRVVLSDGTSITFLGLASVNPTYFGP